VASGENILNKKNIANFDYPERAIYCLSKMWEWNKNNQIDQTPPASGHPPLTGEEKIDLDNCHALIAEAKENKQIILDNFQSNKIIEVLELSVPMTEKIESVDEGVKFAKKNGWPVVLKISGNNILHKADVGGVITNIRSEYQLKKGFEKLKELNGEIQIQQQIEGGVEVILGIKRDVNFGKVMLFGAGGKMAELIKDRNLRLLPLTQNKVESMVIESKVYTLLNGFRNDKVYDLNNFYKVVFALEKLMEEFSGIEEIEINPVIITHNQAFCVDVKIKLC